jgi:hypothetical protein
MGGENKLKTKLIAFFRFIVTQGLVPNMMHIGHQETVPCEIGGRVATPHVPDRDPVS